MSSWQIRSRRTSSGGLRIDGGFPPKRPRARFDKRNGLNPELVEGFDPRSRGEADLSGGASLFGEFGHRGERRRILHGETGQYLPVDLHAGQ